VIENLKTLLHFQFFGFLIPLFLGETSPVDKKTDYFGFHHHHPSFNSVYARSPVDKRQENKYFDPTLWVWC
jgi:hypothetical protein